MTYGQLKNMVLKLLNQYTIAGSPVASSYNNQQDYLNRIPSFADDAILEIATTSKKIGAMVALSSLTSEDIGKDIRYTLPADFYQWKTGMILKTEDGRIVHTNVYKTLGKQYLVIPKRESGDYTIGYFRYPTLLGENPSDSVELDNVEETHTAVAYYVAAQLVIHDDAFLYASFYNKYEDKLAKMSSGISVDIQPVEDSYNLTNCWEGM